MKTFIFHKDSTASERKALFFIHNRFKDAEKI